MVVGVHAPTSKASTITATTIRDFVFIEITPCKNFLFVEIDATHAKKFQQTAPTRSGADLGDSAYFIPGDDGEKTRNIEVNCSMSTGIPGMQVSHEIIEFSVKRTKISSI